MESPRRVTFINTIVPYGNLINYTKEISEYDPENLIDNVEIYIHNFDFESVICLDNRNEQSYKCKTDKPIQCTIVMSNSYIYNIVAHNKDVFIRIINSIDSFNNIQEYLGFEIKN